jgi:hypothetical protein
MDHPARRSKPDAGGSKKFRVRHPALAKLTIKPTGWPVIKALSWGDA